MSEAKYFLSASVFFQFILSSLISEVKIKQSDVLLKLLGIYRVSDYDGSDYDKQSITVYTSKLKNGNYLPSKFSRFNDPIIRDKFFLDIQGEKPVSLEMMKEFVKKFIESDYHLDIVKSFLLYIERDQKITEEEAFYLFEIRQYVNKETFCQLDRYNIESFLLSIWLYVIRYRYESIDISSVSYVDGNSDIRSYHKLKRDIKVCKFDDRNKDLLEEYGKLKKVTPEDLKLFNPVEEYRVRDYPSPDEDPIWEFRNDYDKILQFIKDLNLDSTLFEDFIIYDFYQFSNRISELKNKWDDKISGFKNKKDSELAINIIDELDVFVSIVKDTDKRSILLSKNKLSRYYSDLDSGFTFNNLHNI